MRYGKKWTWIGWGICVILFLGVGLLIYQNRNLVDKLFSSKHNETVSGTSSDRTDKTELVGENTSGQNDISSDLQDIGQQNIMSDGDYLYTIHRQHGETCMVQIFAVEETKITQVWSASVGADARMNVDGGRLTVIYSESATEVRRMVWDVSDPGAPEEVTNEKETMEEVAGETSQSSKDSDETSADKQVTTTEYPFGEDLTLRLEITSAQGKQADIHLVMTHTSTGEKIHEQALRAQNSDWLNRMPDNVIVDHQHCYIGIGCQNKQGHSLYRLYHYNEADGFRKLAEYDWGKDSSQAESCGWIRGNDVYIFSPDGSRNVVYNVVSEEFLKH